MIKEDVKEIVKKHLSAIKDDSRMKAANIACDVKDLFRKDVKFRQYEFVKDNLRVFVKYNMASGYSMSMMFSTHLPKKRTHIRCKDIRGEKFEGFLDKMFDKFIPDIERICEEKQLHKVFSEIGLQEMNTIIVAEDYFRVKTFDSLRKRLEDIRNTLVEMHDDVWERASIKFAKELGFDVDKFKEGNYAWQLKYACERFLGGNLSYDELEKNLKQDELKEISEKISKLEKEIDSKLHQVKNENKTGIC